MLRNFVQNVKNTKWTSILSCLFYFTNKYFCTDNDKMVQDDGELSNWGKTLSSPVEQGGAGIKV